MPTTYYDTLQVAQNANPAVIRASYRALSQQYHPDRNLDDLERANRYMKRINEAYEVLSDPVRRARYDEVIAKAREADHVKPSPQSKPAHSVPTASAATDPLAERVQKEARSRFEKQESEIRTATKQPDTPTRRNADWIGNFGFGCFLVGPVAALLILVLFDGWKLSESALWLLFGMSSLVSGLLWAWRRKDGTVALSPKAADRKPPYQLRELLWFGFVAAVVTARRMPMPEELAKKGWMASLFDTFFLGMLVTPLVAFALSVLIPYAVAKALTKSRRVAWYAGGAVALMLFFAFWVGAENQLKQGKQARIPEPKAPEQVTAAAAQAAAAPNVGVDPRKQAYDMAVRELESRYPRLNPDSSAYDEAFTRQVLDRARELNSIGNEPAVAIRQAASELSGTEQSVRRERVKAVEPLPAANSNRQTDIERTLCTTWPSACR